MRIESADIIITIPSPRVSVCVCEREREKKDDEICSRLTWVRCWEAKSFNPSLSFSSLQWRVFHESSRMEWNGWSDASIDLKVQCPSIQPTDANERHPSIHRQWEREKKRGRDYLSGRSHFRQSKATFFSPAPFAFWSVGRSVVGRQNR